MQKLIVGTVALGALAIFVLTSLSQPPREREQNPEKKGPPPERKGPPPPFDKKGPPPWRPGKIIPPHVRDFLDLSDDQEAKIDELEVEVRAKLLKIFTEDQKRRLQEMREKGPKGPDRDGPPKKGPDRDSPPEKKKGKDRRPDCEGGAEASSWSPRTAFQWCADLASGR